MEDRVERHVVTPVKGISNTVPDLVCGDDELEDCVGLTYSNEALRPIQNTEKTMTLDGTLMCVHETNKGAKHYLYQKGSEGVFYNGTKLNSGSNYVAKQVCTIGNTVIINTADGLLYFLWKDSAYKYIGNKLPEPAFEFSLSQDGYNWNGSTHKVDSQDKCPSFGSPPIDMNQPSVGDDFYVDDDGTTRQASWPTGYINVVVFTGGQKDAAKNMFVGMYAEGKNNAHKNKAFVNPFLVVGALRLYDGSYTYISNPVLMLPNIHGAFSSFYSHYNGAMFGIVTSHYLEYRQGTDYSDWSDIVDNVCIFVSQEIDTLNTEDIATYNLTDSSGEMASGNALIGPWHYLWSSLMSREDVCDLGSAIAKFNSWDARSLYWTAWELAKSTVVAPFKPYSESDIISEIENISTFNLLCDVGLKSNSGLTSTQSKIKRAVLENLTTQEALNTNDYYNHCQIYPAYLETFNRRLNAYNVKRSFFKGFKQFVPYRIAYGKTSPNYHGYTVDVTIEGESTHVIHKFNTYDIFYSGMWFFYPDTRATHVKITESSTTILDVDLKEHRGLNGAYYISKFPSTSDTQRSSSVTESVTTPDPETLQNYIIQSAVDNPYIFNASGYVKIGQGTVLGMASLTTALNQDAYKVTNIIAFTTQGVWTAQINSTGEFSSVSPPFSREICTNMDSITMIDGGVFYVSERGLMLISDQATGCVSEMVCGKDTADYDSFIDFIQDCNIAYDYRDNQLWLINNTKVGDSLKYNYHWIYNIKSRTLSRKNDTLEYISTTVSYPDTLIQDADKNVYSFYEEPNINADANIYTGSIKSRPLKLDGSAYLKSLRRVKKLEMLSGSSTLTLYGSNDLKTWTELKSLQGKPYRFFKYKMSFTNMKATDTFSGLVMDTQVRYTDKPH